MFNRTTICAVIFTGGLLLASPAMGLDIDSSSAIENLRTRLDRLEIGAAEEDRFSIFSAHKALTFSGVLELEGYFKSAEDQPDESGLAVTTAQLGIEAVVDEQIHAHLVFLHEEGESQSLEMDEANIVLSRQENSGATQRLIGGKSYLPFGNYSSTMVSDPLTLELGEMNKTALTIGRETEQLHIQLAGFNGDQDISGDNDTIDNLVFSLSITPAPSLTIGASYTCDLTESGQELLANATTAYTENIKAASAFISATIGQFTLDAEYVGAITEFAQTMVDDPATEALTGRKPAAFFVELSYTPAKTWFVAGRYEQAKDFQNDLQRYGLVTTYGLAENTSLSVEYLYSDDDQPQADTAHTVTAQLAIEF